MYMQFTCRSYIFMHMPPAVAMPLVICMSVPCSSVTIFFSSSSARSGLCCFAQSVNLGPKPDEVSASPLTPMCLCMLCIQ